MKNPKLISKPFAQNGQKNAIPENFSGSMESNQATWDTGFGQITMIPVAAGGMPPKGQDFNGIFNQISENVVYLSKGGKFKFSTDYAASINGYPKGAILQSDDEKKEYQSIIDNNKVNFNTATQTQIDAAWKLISTDDMLQQIASKQPTGNYATTEALNNGLALKFDKAAIVQEPGRWTEIAMSQKAVTDALNEKASNAALTTGLANKFDKTGGEITGNGVVVELKNTLSGASMLGFTGNDNIQRGWIGFPDARNRLALVNSLTGKALVLTESGKLTYADKEIYSVENTKIDRNGNLKVSGTDALSDYPVGAPIPWPQSTAPTGFLICNGQSFNKTTYPLLAVTYPSGMLPDMRDEFIRGASASRSALSLEGHALQGHGHMFFYNNTQTTENAPGSGAAMHRDGTTLSAANRVGAPVSLDGYGTVNYSTETRPRNIAFLYIVRAA